MRPLRRFGILVLTIVAASVWGCGSTATKEGTGEYVDDSVITAKVKGAIFNDSTLMHTYTDTVCKFVCEALRRASTDS